MSREFEESVRLAAECYVEAYGLDGAIDQLRERREPGGENDRVHAALAYLKRQEGEDV